MTEKRKKELQFEDTQVTSKKKKTFHESLDNLSYSSQEVTEEDKSQGRENENSFTPNDNDELIDKQVEEEKRKLTEYENLDYLKNQKIFNQFNDLKPIIEKNKLDIKNPEIVSNFYFLYKVVGMQSDGKSSFIEALLGFQFNTIDTRINCFKHRNWN
jgi:hypothetical protein